KPLPMHNPCQWEGHIPRQFHIPLSLVSLKVPSPSLPLVYSPSCFHCPRLILYRSYCLLSLNLDQPVYTLAVTKMLACTCVGLQNKEWRDDNACTAILSTFHNQPVSSMNIPVQVRY
ncbi:unnamed protein product, partial [Owenia fusiformis]